MTIEQSIQRLQWRFSNGSFSPVQKDIECLNHITEWINQQRTAVLQHDTHFAKLYCHVFAQEVNFYEGNIKLAQQKMREYLSLTVPKHYDKFGKTMTEARLNAFSKKIGLSMKHPMIKTEDEKLSDDEIINKNKSELEEMFTGEWSQEQIDKSLNAEISSAIHKFRTKP